MIFPAGLVGASLPICRSWTIGVVDKCLIVGIGHFISIYPEGLKLNLGDAKVKLIRFLETELVLGGRYLHHWLGQ